MEKFGASVSSRTQPMNPMKDSETGPNSTSAIPRLQYVERRLEEIRLLLGNTLAAVRGQEPGSIGKEDKSQNCLETTIGGIERLAGDLHQTASELRDRIGECS